MSLAGCAVLVPPQPRTVLYRCDAGREFAVDYRQPGSPATIRISGMQFELQREDHGEPEERYGCSVLTLWRAGNTVRVELQGEKMYSNCSPVP